MKKENRKQERRQQETKNLEFSQELAGGCKKCREKAEECKR